MRKPIYALMAYATLGVASPVCTHADSFKDPPTCEQWIYQFNKNNTWDLSNKNWLGGFLSGMAFTDRDQQNILRCVNDSFIFHSVYMYCKEHPDETIDFGAEAFFSELKKCSDPEGFSVPAK
jgi:hypothetical protein